MKKYMAPLALLALGLSATAADAFMTVEIPTRVSVIDTIPGVVCPDPEYLWTRKEGCYFICYEKGPHYSVPDVKNARECLALNK